MENPILKTLKDGDIVLMEIQSSERASYKEICKITNLKFHPIDEKFNFSWLDFKGEVLYSNFRLHKSMVNSPMGNCLSINEIIPPELLENYVRMNGFWKSDTFLMSDEELEYKQKLLKLSI